MSINIVKVNQLEKDKEYYLLDALGHPGRICKIIDGNLYSSDCITPYNSLAIFTKMDITHQELFNMEFIEAKRSIDMDFAEIHRGIIKHELPNLYDDINSNSYIHVEATYCSLDNWLLDEQKIMISVSEEAGSARNYATISLTLEQFDDIALYVQQLKDIITKNNELRRVAYNEDV